MDVLGIGLHLGQSNLHHWVLQYGLDLRIGHGSLLSFFIGHPAHLLRDFELSLLKPYFGLLVLRIEFENAFESIDCFVVLLEHLKTVGLFKKSLDVIRLDLQGLLGISFGLTEIHQFGET